MIDAHSASKTVDFPLLLILFFCFHKKGASRRDCVSENQVSNFASLKRGNKKKKGFNGARQKGMMEAQQTRQNYFRQVHTTILSKHCNLLQKSIPQRTTQASRSCRRHFVSTPERPCAAESLPTYVPVRVRAWPELVTITSNSWT